MSSARAEISRKDIGTTKPPRSAAEAFVFYPEIRPIRDRTGIRGKKAVYFRRISTIFRALGVTLIAVGPWYFATVW